MVRAISVVVADPKKSTRVFYLKQLQHESRIQVVGVAGTKREVVRALKLKPRILLLDWQIFALSGTPLLPLVRQQSPETKVILLVDRIHPMRLLHALSDGVRGYLERMPAATSLIKAVRAVDGGDAWISRAMVPMFISMLSRSLDR